MHACPRASPEGRFGLAMLRRPETRWVRGFGPDHGRVGDVSDPSSDCGRDGGAMLGHAPTEAIGRDQEKTIPTLEGPRQGFRAVEVAEPDIDAGRGERRQVIRAARNKNHSRGLDRLEHQLRHTPAELAVRSADHDRHLRLTYVAAFRSTTVRLDVTQRTS